MFKLCCFHVLLLLATPVAAACPTASDMARGVEIKTVSPRGDHNTHLFRRTGNMRIDHTRKSAWLSISNTVRTRLIHGLLPLERTVLESTDASPILKDTTFSYPEQDLSKLRPGPREVFTATSIAMATDGFAKATTTQYEAGQLMFSVLNGCRLKTIEIAATEDWDGIEAIYSYLYFTDLGFGLELSAQYPGRTTSRRIISIAAAGR